MSGGPCLPSGMSGGGPWMPPGMCGACFPPGIGGGGGGGIGLAAWWLLWLVVLPVVEVAALPSAAPPLARPPARASAIRPFLSRPTITSFRSSIAERHDDRPTSEVPRNLRRVWEEGSGRRQRAARQNRFRRALVLAESRSLSQLPQATECPPQDPRHLHLRDPNLTGNLRLGHVAYEAEGEHLALAG